MELDIWPALTPMGGTDSRSGAINSEGIVIYNYSVLIWMPQKTVSILMLHELLEASGIYDNNYDLSTLLSAPLILEVLPLKQNKQELWNRFKDLLAYKSQLNVSKEIPRSYPLQLAGGVTGIGSGGDPLVATFKAYTFAKALTDVSNLENLFTIQSLRVILDNPLLTLTIGAELKSIEIPNPKNEWIIERLRTYDWVKVFENGHNKEIKLNSINFYLMLLSAITHPEFLFNDLAAPKKILDKLNQSPTN